MTTQATTIIAGNPMMSKIYTKGAATDEAWSGNVLEDTFSAQSIGILQPNSILTWVQPTYTAGGCAWRLQNAQTLAVSARGFSCPVAQGSKVYLGGSVRVNPNDILTVFPRAAPTLGQTGGLVWVTTTKGTELFTFDGADDAFNNALTAINDQTLGDAFFNSTLTAIKVQCLDTGVMDRLQIVDNSGGIVMSVQGQGRGYAAGTDNYVNAECSGLSVQVGKGFKLQIKSAQG
tara:strand:+ start:610 stop:1305 length:696 start_codon:yes stop_codon:yes gene_type:complete